MLLRGRETVRPQTNVLPGTAVGIVGIVLWIALSHLRLEAVLPEYLPSALVPAPRVAFNPFEQLHSPWAIGLFLAARLMGLVILVPLAEELFWRGFLARWLISPDWRQVPIGRFSTMSFVVVTLLFTLSHPEWFAAAVYCALLNALLIYTKDLWNCIVAHSVSNLLLAVYVVAGGEWWLW
jgi:CAAX prenyl protease-like protein